MNAAQTDVREALATAAREMLCQALDDATEIAATIEETGQRLDTSVLGALGALDLYDHRAKAMHAAVGAARAVLIRARDGAR